MNKGMKTKKYAKDFNEKKFLRSCNGDQLNAYDELDSARDEMRRRNKKKAKKGNK
jgi:hypothetical protein